MNTLHGVIAFAALVGVVCRLIRMHRTPGSPFISWNVWAGAHAALGAGLLGVVLAAVQRCQLHEEAITALLLGVSGIMLTYWRRRREDR